jgi:hypothetical protein
MIGDAGLTITDAGVARGVGQGDIGREPAAAPQAKTDAAADGAPLPAPEVPVAGKRETWQDWSYVVPQSWQAEVMSDGVMIRAPKTNHASPGFTFICLRPLRAAKADLYAQGIEILGEFFGQGFSSFRDYDLGSPHVNRLRGVNGDGWPYIMLRTMPIDRQNRRTGYQARILLFHLGNQVAPIIGFEHPDERTLECAESGRCLAWTLLYHSLAFPKLRAPGNAGLRDKLIGTWSSGSSLEIVQDTFNSDGAYINVAAYKTYQDLSSTTVLEKTTSWFGEGRFVVHGDQLSVWRVKGKPQTNLFRIVEEENSMSAGGWLQVLYRVNLISLPKETVAYESRMVIRK